MIAVAEVECGAGERPVVLRLLDEDQKALTAVLLRLMERDLDLEKNDERRLAREGVRDQLRFRVRNSSPDGRRDHERLELEDPDWLDRALRAVSSQARALQILLEAFSYQPWQTLRLSAAHRGHLNEESRSATLRWLLRAFDCDFAPDLLDAVEEQLNRRSLRRIFLVLGLGGLGIVVGAYTAGVAAPAIGTAIGGAMGLSGAAATSAGLAWLGGGAIAAGGYGVAGGTALLAGLGAAGGVGLGAVGGLKVTQEHPGEDAAGTAEERERAELAQLAIETGKLRALIHLCARPEMKDETKATGLAQELVVELAIAHLVEQRALALHAGKARPAEALADELKRTVALRHQVGLKARPFPFE